MFYDVIIIGAGPAGTAAAVYATRKKLKTLLLTESFGGQSIVSNDIQNWIGEPHISGFDLAEKFKKHVQEYSSEVEVKMPELATAVKTIACESGERVCDFEVSTDKENIYQTKTLILTTGARRKKLDVPGEKKFEGKGVAYCSTCDAPLFARKNVAVIGGGNAGLEAAVDLLPYASKIFLLHRSATLKGDALTQDQIKNNPKVEVLLNAEIQEIRGDNFVEAIIYRDNKNNASMELAVGGVFVEIGSVPNSEIVKDMVELDQWGQIKIDSKHSSTSRPGIFAAGDVTDDPYKQNNISAGDGVKAALAAYAYLLKRGKQSPAMETQNNHV